LEARDIIVIAASAGGVEALSQLVAALPPQLPAAVFAVVHFPAHATSVLPQILQRHGRLPAVHPEDGTAVRHGVIYVAPPNRHLTLHRGEVRLTRGPRENGHRPSADPLFRSAARVYGRRVIGVVLTGNLDDGTAGLAAVARHGGVTVVQDPAEALYGGMPASAVANVAVDHVLPLAAIPALLMELANTPANGNGNGGGAVGEGDARDEMEVEIAELEPGAIQADDRPGTPSGYSCPECHGSLFEIREGEMVRFRCRVGHAYGAETLLAEQAQSVEGALWTALQTLKERAAMGRRMARRMEERGSLRSAAIFHEQAEDADRRAALIREVLREGAAAEPFVPPEEPARAAG
jgi:two-component system, chemotaxis family, protein-glutamate methylesterase/glutaminase